MKYPIIFAAILALASGANAKVEPSSLIGDNMVLQQSTEVCLWGKAAPGANL